MGIVQLQMKSYKDVSMKINMMFNSENALEVLW